MKSSQKMYIIVSILCFLLLASCGKNENEEELTPNDAQVSTESLQASGGAEGSDESKKSSADAPVTVTIRIDWDQVYIDDVKCDSLEELKEKIIASKCTKIELLHQDAMKDMKDFVIELLNDIENVLSIKVNYNDG